MLPKVRSVDQNADASYPARALVPSVRPKADRTAPSAILEVRSVVGRRQKVTQHKYWYRPAATRQPGRCRAYFWRHWSFKVRSAADRQQKKA